MVRVARPSSFAVKKIHVVYAPKASCFVMSPAARSNFAQFCQLLMAIDKATGNNKEVKTSGLPNKKQRCNISQEITKGSLTSGPSCFSNFQLLYFHHIL